VVARVVTWREERRGEEERRGVRDLAVKARPSDGGGGGGERVEWWCREVVVDE